MIGVNLLREGLDLPEVSLVAILDADKEGFLRSERSLTQTVGRAARNLNGRVIMYADKITESMQKTIDETNRRRTLQEKYNQDNNIQPQALRKNKKSAFNVYGTIPEETPAIAADPVIQFMNKDQILKNIEMVKEQMQKAAKELDFASATKFRDEMFALEKILEKK